MVDTAKGRTLTPELLNNQVLHVSRHLFCGLGSLFFAYKYIVYQTLPVWTYLASFMTVVGIQSWKSGSNVYRKMKDELTCVLKDVIGTPCVLFYNLGRSTNHDDNKNNNNSSSSSSKYDFLQKWLIWLSTISMYNESYGPFSITVMFLFVLPINVLNAVWKDARGLNLVQSILVVTRFIFLTFGFMQFFCVATHLAYHRFVSHRSFQPTNRFITFIICIIGALGGQRGPLWWASIHRRHHKYCDTKEDIHSPKIHGPLYAHAGWYVDRRHFQIDPTYVMDWLKSNPELLLIDATACIFQRYFLRYCPIVLVHVNKFILLKTREVILYFVPLHMKSMAIRILRVLLIPLKTQGADCAVFMGFILSLHFTSFVNSVCHEWVDNNNKEQPCQARMVAWVGYLNGGDGFHGNHHGNAGAARAAPTGCFDLTYTVIKCMEWLGLVRIPASVGKREDWRFESHSPLFLHYHPNPIDTI